MHSKCSGAAVEEELRLDLAFTRNGSDHDGAERDKMSAPGGGAVQ